MIIRNTEAFIPAFILSLLGGIVVGLFLKASAVPFGPIILGLEVGAVAAAAVSILVCWMARSNYRKIVLGYPLGVAMTLCVINFQGILAEGRAWVIPASFVVNFIMWSIIPLLIASLWSYVNNQRNKHKE